MVPSAGAVFVGSQNLQNSEVRADTRISPNEGKEHSGTGDRPGDAPTLINEVKDPICDRPKKPPANDNQVKVKNDSANKEQKE